MHTRQRSQTELQIGEETIFKVLQREMYLDEITALSIRAPNENGQEAIGKQQVFQLMPMLDNSGLLRECDRISSAENVGYIVRHPISLPEKFQFYNISSL